MRKLYFVVLCSACTFIAQAQTVKNINAAYHDGQIFITWKNVANADTGFYYVYKNSVPITSANIQSSTYLGRVMYNSSYDFRFTSIYQPNNPKYFITNDNPLVELSANQGLFVMNCTTDGAGDYFAVRCDYGSTSPNWQVTAGKNATTVATTEHMDPVRCYLMDKINAGGAVDTMLVFVHYGTNVAAGDYPAMANEGCLPFHFGLVQGAPIGGNNPTFVKFHGGGGDFINNAIGSDVTDAWKITFDDWIPAFQEDELGTNTRWLGYSEFLDVYHFDDNTPPPTTGIIKCYTYYRVNWELNWIEKQWPNSIDTNRIFLSGSSQGCSAVYTRCLIDPDKYAAGQTTDGKFNLDAPDDDNPDCKFNENKSGRKDSRAIWGNEDSTNLKTDIPLPRNPSGVYKIYDLTNMNYMFDKQQYQPIPFLIAINGKNDNNTCWEEKVGAYASIQDDNIGGNFYWDLRGHGGGDDNSWPALVMMSMERFATNKSFPGFSNCDLDGNPGSASNPYPPYYSGDSIGTLHGNLNWIDSSIVDEADQWQAFVYLFADTLKDETLLPDTLPKFSKTDISIKRAQSFKDFSAGKKIYWLNIHNGDTIQTGMVKQKYSGNQAKLLTAKKVKVYPDGNIIRFQTVPPQKSETLNADEALSITCYPNPFTNLLMVNVTLSRAGAVQMQLLSLTGAEAGRWTFDGQEGENDFTINTSGLPSGMFFLSLITPNAKEIIKVEKQ